MVYYRSKGNKQEWKSDIKKEQRKREISIVYRFKSWIGKNIIYVGRADRSVSRVDDHIGNIGMFGRHEGIGANLSEVEYCIIDGGLRDVHSFYEECLQYHLNDPNYLRNDQHPEQPLFRNREYKCPICEGKNSRTYEHFEINSESYYRNW